MSEQKKGLNPNYSHLSVLGNPKLKPVKKPGFYDFIYKCTSRQCDCKIVKAEPVEGGWRCTECGAEYIRDNRPPPPPPHDPAYIQNVRVAFKELSITEQVECLRGILLEHAYYRGLAGLPKEYEPPPQDEIDLNYEDGVRHSKE